MTEAVEYFNIAISLLILGAVFFKLGPDSRREKLQRDLFKIRNDLFLYMHESGYSYQEPGYLEVRRLLNGAIRLADEINVPAILAVALFYKDDKSAPDVVRATEDENLKKRLLAAEQATAIRIALFLLCSPLGAIFTFLMLVRATFRISQRLPLLVIMAGLRPVRAFLDRSRTLTMRPC